MTDRLKLSDAKGDAEAAKIASALELTENKKRIKELQKNIADLEKLAERKNQPKRPAAPSGNKIGARKNAGFKAVSTAPSINLTPRGNAMVPVGYTTVQDLSNSVGVAKSVRFNGDPVYLLDSSTQPACKGDEMGSGGGVRSGTVNGEVKPVKGSSTVRVAGKPVVRQGDPCTMNGGNNPGVYATVQAPSSAAPKDAIATSNPPIALETPKEQAAFDKWLDKTVEDIGQALKHPVEGVKGAVKGLVNMVPGTAELLLKAAAEQRASELADAAMTQTLFGQDAAAKALSGVAGEARTNADKIDLPKLPMNNPAQQGGDTISAAVQIFAGGMGILKSGVKWLGGLGKGGKAAEAVKAAEVVSGADKIKSAVTESGPARDGVKIIKDKDVVRANNLTEVDSIIAARRADPAGRIRSLAADPDSGKLRMEEAKTAFEVEDQFGYFGRYQRPSPDAPKGDFYSLSGPYKGKTFDDFGSEISDGMIKQLQIKPKNTERLYFESLEQHLTEADYVILNISKLKAQAPSLYEKTLIYINNHPMTNKVINVTK